MGDSNNESLPGDPGGVGSDVQLIATEAFERLFELLEYGLTFDVCPGRYGTMAAPRYLSIG